MDLPGRFITFLFGVILALIAGSSAALAGKLDLYGFQPGQEQRQVLESPIVDCIHIMPPRSSYDHESWDCRHAQNGDQVSFQFSLDLPGRPLLRVMTVIHTADTPENIRASVTQQYGVRPTVIKRQDTISDDLYRFDLSNGTTLELQGSGLQLTDYRLKKLAEEAKRQMEVQRKPLPKF